MNLLLLPRQPPYVNGKHFCMRASKYQRWKLPRHGPTSRSSKQMAARAKLAGCCNVLYVPECKTCTSTCTRLAVHTYEYGAYACRGSTCEVSQGICRGAVDDVTDALLTFLQLPRAGGLVFVTHIKSSALAVTLTARDAAR